MRLWHYKLIKYLPNSQLISQWRELNAIYNKQQNHILINYIYNYPKSYLLNYSNKVIKEMEKRNFNIKSYNKYNEYFKDIKKSSKMFKEHNDEYLKICYYNLYEKYIRGQKDFNDEICNNLNNYYKNNFKQKE